MEQQSSRALPGYVAVAGAADRLHLAPRSVRDLIYAGRLPSARLGRRHFLKVPDVEAERRRRLGLPMPAAEPGVRRQRPPLRNSARRSPTPVDVETAEREPTARQDRSAARRERALQRAAGLERWLRSGHGSATPTLPFSTTGPQSEAAVCDVCGRPVRIGGRMVIAEPADGRASARLCLSCARRAVLAWSDSRRREAAAARLFAQGIGLTYTSLFETASAA